MPCKICVILCKYLFNIINNYFLFNVLCFQLNRIDFFDLRRKYFMDLDCVVVSVSSHQINVKRFNC